MKKIVSLFLNSVGTNSFIDAYTTVTIDCAYELRTGAQPHEKSKLLKIINCWCLVMSAVCELNVSDINDPSIERGN